MTTMNYFLNEPIWILYLIQYLRSLHVCPSEYKNEENKVTIYYTKGMYILHFNQNVVYIIAGNIYYPKFMFSGSGGTCWAFRYDHFYCILYNVSITTSYICCVLRHQMRYASINYFIQQVVYESRVGNTNGWEYRLNIKGVAQSAWISRSMCITKSRCVTSRSWIAIFVCFIYDTLNTKSIHIKI